MVIDAAWWRGRSVAVAIVALGAAALGFAGLRHTDALLSTRLAEATGPSPARPVAASVRGEGRVVSYPGAEVVVGTEIGGTIITLDLKEKDVVKKGDLVAAFVADEPRAALAEAFARLRQAQVDANYLASEVRRTETLALQGALSAQVLDRAHHDRDAAVAAQNSAAATAARLQAALKKARVFAPIDGTVVEVYAHQGETVVPGARLVTLVDLKRMRVEAEIDEFDAPRLRVGEPVAIRVEGLSGSWRGKVQELPDRVVSRRLKPEDPSRPSDTRVLLVKVALLEELPARFGQRVELEISAPQEGMAVQAERGANP
jgi:RND family efflux transporter MFP subunit